MSGLLKISEAAVLAIHSLVCIAIRGGEPATNSEIAAALDASENHLSKVLQRLAKNGFVRSHRGPRGGFVLGKDPADISLRELYELFDGAVDSNACLLGTPVCNGRCMFGGLLDDMQSLVLNYMEHTSLKDAVNKLELECTRP
jgi:Rrf2 family protein